MAPENHNPQLSTLNSQPCPFSECGGFARDSAKVEDQVRFLARTLVRSTISREILQFRSDSSPETVTRGPNRAMLRTASGPSQTTRTPILVAGPRAGEVPLQRMVAGGVGRASLVSTCRPPPVTTPGVRRTERPPSRPGRWHPDCRSAGKFLLTLGELFSFRLESLFDLGEDAERLVEILEDGLEVPV